MPSLTQVRAALMRRSLSARDMMSEVIISCQTSNLTFGTPAICRRSPKAWPFFTAGAPARVHLPADALEPRHRTPDATSSKEQVMKKMRVTMAAASDRLSLARCNVRSLPPRTRSAFHDQRKRTSASRSFPNGCGVAPVPGRTLVGPAGARLETLWPFEQRHPLCWLSQLELLAIPPMRGEGFVILWNAGSSCAMFLGPICHGRMVSSHAPAQLARSRHAGWVWIADMLSVKR